MHFLKLCRAIPQNVLIVNYEIANIPYVDKKERFEVVPLGERVFKLTICYGFMDNVSIPHALEIASRLDLFPFKLNIDRATYMVEIPNIMASKKKKSLRFYWQERLFAFLVRNYSANLNIEFYELPYNRTMAIGTYYIL